MNILAKDVILVAKAKTDRPALMELDQLREWRQTEATQLRRIRHPEAGHS